MYEQHILLAISNPLTLRSEGQARMGLKELNLDDSWEIGKYGWIRSKKLTFLTYLTPVLNFSKLDAC